jgi:aryl sulfotransferase
MLVRGPTRELRNWVADSRRWNDFRARPGDIVVATAPKCGTTWTQRIVGMLLRQSSEPFPVQDSQPWIDMRSRPIGDILAELENQPGRRSLKTHSPLDALPFHDDMLYIHVARDPRDACMSWHNHVMGYTPFARALMDQNGLTDETIGRPYPVPPSDPRDFFRAFLRVPEFAPFDDFTIAEYCDVERTYWAARHRPNVLMVHYNDLKTDLDGEMRRIASFCGIETPEALWPKLVEAAGFAAMKRDAAALLPTAGAIWDGGGDRFLHKGTNERWVEIATPDDLALYEAEASKGMSANLKAWAERGRLVAGDPAAMAD